MLARPLRFCFVSFSSFRFFLCVVKFDPSALVATTRSLVPLERLRDDLQEHLTDRKQVGELTMNTSMTAPPIVLQEGFQFFFFVFFQLQPKCSFLFLRLSSYLVLSRVGCPFLLSGDRRNCSI